MDVFLSYRRSEKAEEVARWLQSELESEPIESTTGQIFRLDVFVDVTEPHRPHFQRNLTPILEHSRALVVLADAGAAKRKEEHDYLYEELDWWASNRKKTPFIVVQLEPDSAKTLLSDAKFKENEWDKVNPMYCFLEKWRAHHDRGTADKDDFMRKLRESIRDFGLVVDHHEARRLKRRALIAIVFAAVAMIAAGFAWYQSAIAQSREREAQARRDAAENLVAGIQANLIEKLKALDKLDLMQDATALVDAYYARFPDSDGDEDGERRRWSAKRQTALVAMDTNDLPRATNAIGVAILALQAKVTSEPENDLWHDDLANALETQAKIMWMRGEKADAVATMRRAVAHARQSVKLNREIPLSHNNLAWKLKRLADWVTWRNDGEAETLYREAIEIQEWLTKEHWELRFFRDLSATLEGLGTMYFDAGRATDARAPWQRTLEIAEETLRHYPENRGYRYDKSCSLRLLGDVALAEGQNDAGLALYAEAERLLEDLVEHDPLNVTWRHQLARTLEHTGAAHFRNGTRQIALEYFTRARQLLEKLAAEDPQTYRWRAALSRTLRCVADTQAALANLATARETFAVARRHLESWAQREPTDPAAAGAYGIVLEAEAEMLQRYRQQMEAAKVYALSVEFDGRLARSEPTEARWVRAAAKHSRLQGELLLIANQPTPAITALEKSLEHARLAAQLDPGAVISPDPVETAVLLGEALKKATPPNPTAVAGAIACGRFFLSLPGGAARDNATRQALAKRLMKLEAAP